MPTSWSEHYKTNGILGNEDTLPSVARGYGPHTIGLECMLPLGGGGLHKPWAPAGPDSNFPCCWGTLSEMYSKLADSIYFRSPDNSSIFVNMFESSTVRFGTVTLTQNAAFPVSEESTTTISIMGGALKVMLRVPWWVDASGSNSVKINGQPVDTALKASTYLPLNLKDGDKVEVHFPMTIRWEQLDDPRPAFAGVGAAFYGPLLLAGLTTSEALPLSDGKTIADVLKRNSSTELSFEASLGSSDCPALKYHLVPFNTIRNEHGADAYTVYWHTAAGASGKTTPAGTPTLSMAASTDGRSVAGWTLSGGATIVSTYGEEEVGGHEHHHHGHRTHRALETATHRHASPLTAPRPPVEDYDEITGNHYSLRHQAGMQYALRSGGKGASSMAVLAAPLNGSGTLSSVEFSFRYSVGYGTGGDGVVVSLAFHSKLDCPAHSVISLWNSSALSLPSYDHCHTVQCYSKPLNVSVSGLSIDTHAPGALALHFENNDHNIQVLLPIEIKLGWRKA